MGENIPTTIGKYQIIREIARSNDIVYEAYDPRMNRRVAIKELAMPTGASKQQREDRLKRFEREARAAGSLVHPNIVTVYEVGTDGDKNFIAMEYLTGRNLRKEIDKNGFIEPKEAVHIAIEVLEGLQFAHEHGVIHRDIKPDNVQLLEDGQVKLTDFGIARLTFEPNITMDGQVFGTPSYMSPEQINGKEIDARSDIFGVGVVLYEMVSGKKPFQGDSVVSITYAIMNKQPDQPQQANYSLWQVIQKALEKTPDMRYKSAGEMANDLKKVLKDMESGSVVLDPIQPQVPFTAAGVIPGPPPVYNPYLPGAMPQPLQPQAPMRTPYGTPMPTAYQQPYPQAYSQPYQQPYQPYQAPPPGQVPVYYPPPPRTPLLKPETKQGIAKFFITVLLIGATIGFLILVLNAMMKPSTAETSPPAKSDTVATNQPGQTNAKTQTPPSTVDQSSLPRSFRTEPSTVPRATTNNTPVDLEMIIKEADDAVDAAAISDSPAMRQEMWTKADDLFGRAIEAATTAPIKTDIMVRAWNKYVIVGDALGNRGLDDRAREAYRHAKGFATSPEQIRQADKAITDHGG
ncbi:MAG TPA: protein kinase [Fimbriimonadaceae bacterium]|nr:protein kinase [Fimbriimonadaceae bacterium]